MWLGQAIIGQLIGTLVGALIIHLIWKATHPGEGWFGK